MNTTTTQTAANATGVKAEVKRVADDMDSRVIFSGSDTQSPAEQCAAYIARCQEQYSDFAEVPIVAVGLSQDDDGSLVFDPEIYSEGMLPTVSVVTKRVTNAPSIPLCISIYPNPTLELLMESDDGMAWVRNQIETQTNHSAVRGLRPSKQEEIDYTDPNLAQSALPTSVSDYIITTRGGSSKYNEAFDTHWKTARTALGEVFTVFKAANVTKSELANCLQSQYYAEQSTYEHLENHSQGSLFVLYIRLLMQLAEQDSLDTSLLQSWLDGRAEKKIEPAKVTEREFAEDFDPMAALIAAATKSNKPAAETPAEAAQADAPAAS